MDVSTSIVHDPKFRLLHREHPEHVPAAFLAYVAMLGESWKAGRRVSVTEAWPTLIPFDADVVTSMIQVRLIDRNGLPPRRAWDGWWTPAYERREQSRERWRRANENRRSEPRGDSDVTARSPRGLRDVPRPPSAPSVPTVRPSVPPSGRAKLTAQERKDEERRRALEHLSEEFRAGRLSEIDYQRQRKDLAS
jgi:hypothetical protein